MATVNLGRLKPVFKGAYNSGTAYVVDDIVVYANETYINIQAGTNQQPNTATGYWTKLAAKGTDGTDVSTTLTTQGDLLVKGASALERLAIGTSGQALLVNGSANGFVFGSAGKQTEIHVYADESTGNVSSSGDFVNWNFTPTISGKVFLAHTGSHRAQSSAHYYCQYYFNNGSGVVEQHEQGFNYSPSNTTHNQGWAVSFIATTNSNADSTTPLTVTANTQCNFRVKNNSGDGSSAGGDAGKDHIVSAIVFET